MEDVTTPIYDVDRQLGIVLPIPQSAGSGSFEPLPQFVEVMGAKTVSSGRALRNWESPGKSCIFKWMALIWPKSTHKKALFF